MTIHRELWTMVWKAAIGVVLTLTACGGPPVPRLVPVDAHPPRPALDADADTNDPRAYAIFAERHVGVAPDSAAAAFWWAARLDPWWAEPVYGRAVALLASRHYSMRARMAGVRPEPERDELVMATVDSLITRASSLDPFHSHSLDYVISGQLPTYMAEQMPDPADGGVFAFNSGNYKLAVQLLGKALERHPGQVEVRYVRAQAFYHLRDYDSTATELVRALDTLSARDTSRKILAPYQSKEILYFALGTAQAARNDTAAARAAYEQALVENLGFAMAHVRLAGLSLARADTAAALRELDAALLTAPDDPALRYFYGELLSSCGKTRAAIDELLRAESLDPDFASPHLMLGRIAEALGERENAVDEYAAYLQLAPRRLDDRRWVEQRLAVLRDAKRR